MAEILVLEDVAAFRRILDKVLSEDGHTVTTSDTGEVIYDAEIVNRIDMMITDLDMPWVNGIEAILLAKKMRPNLKIIAMSGGGESLKEDYLPACMQFGASAVLRKPFEPDEMLKQVRRVLAA